MSQMALWQDSEQYDAPSIKEIRRMGTVTVFDEVLEVDSILQSRILVQSHYSRDFHCGVSGSSFDFDVT